MQQGSKTKIKVAAVIAIVVIAVGSQFYLKSRSIERAPSNLGLDHKTPLTVEPPKASNRERRMIVQFAGCAVDSDTFGDIAHATESLSKTLEKYSVKTEFDKTEGKCEIRFVNGAESIAISRFGTDLDMFNKVKPFFSITAVESDSE